jgi:hypothetical protein
MFFKKVIFGLLALASSAVVFIAAVSFISGEPLAIPIVKEGPTSSLTGLPGKDGPVVVVKIDDSCSSPSWLAER